MPSNLQIALLIIVPTGVFLAILRAPYWFSHSLHRHRLWRLRDAIVDDMISGRLPKDHPAVRELLRRAEFAIHELRSLSALTFYVWSWVRGRSDREVLARMRHGDASCEGLDDEQQHILTTHRECLSYLCGSATLTGTWVGLATVLRFVVPAMREMRKRASHEDVKATLWLATSQATERTSLGRCSTEYVTRDLDARLAGVP